MGSFPMAAYYLHYIVHGAKWARFLDEVFCETGIVAVMAESCHMFFVTYGEPASGLSDICLIAIRRMSDRPELD